MLGWVVLALIAAAAVRGRNDRPGNRADEPLRARSDPDQKLQPLITVCQS